MNQLAVIDDLAAKRSAAARKAVATRRARLAADPHAPVNLFKAPARRNIDSALAAFEVEANAEMPDWHKAAMLLKQALTERQGAKVLTIKPPKVAAIAAPVWHDYEVKSVGAFHVVSPMIVVTFADGEVVRAPAVGKRGKPVNIGRGLRVACAFYQTRQVWRSGKSCIGANFSAVPEIVACHCEETGEDYNPELCTIRTEDVRRAAPK